MKRPLLVLYESQLKSNPSLLNGEGVLIGVPDRTFFELYDGAHSSEKLYSVQTRDLPSDTASLVYNPTDTVNTFLETNEDVKNDHVFVELSADVLQLLQDRKVYTPVNAFVYKNAFKWIPLDEVNVEVIPEKKKSNTKAIIAALIAAISLLN